MQKTKFHSYAAGTLAKGCQMCVKGRKLVLFVTGLCSEKCFYCPISDQKNGKDDVYANEWKIDSDEDILEEARLCSATGAGITGGDPLVTLDKTKRIIRLLKKEFGDHFHIHLYTPLRLVTKETMTALHEAGLDEIRFHPNLDDETLWERLNHATAFDWDVGIEIPAIPGKLKEIKKLITFSAGIISFMNLNELEYSDTNAQSLSEKGLVTKDPISYGIQGSEETALDVLKWAENEHPNINFHYCTATLKDKVQLSKRVKLRAEGVKKPYDVVTPDGTLIRGAVYLECSIPGVGYHKRLLELGDKTAELEELKKKILEKVPISDEKVGVDFEKKRILVPRGKVKEINRRLPYCCAIVEEYPTKDEFEVEIEILAKK
jgi:pyruvate formate-lyase activating enzyme-like uncharacterized protein